MTNETSRPRLRVVVGVLTDEAGRVLINQRLPGTHMAGRWELPGGKLMPGESEQDGLRRELHEELGIHVGATHPLITITHDYPDRSVILMTHRVTAYEGTPRGVEGQALRWLPPDELADAELLEADRPIVAAIRRVEAGDSRGD